MFSIEWWNNWGPSVVVPVLGLVEAIVLLWQGFKFRHRPIKALGWSVLPLVIITGVLLSLTGPSLVWFYVLWGTAGAAAMIAGASGRGRGVLLGGLFMLAFALAGYLPSEFAYVDANVWAFAAMAAGLFCGAIVAVLGLREDEQTAYIVGIGVMVSSLAMCALYLKVVNLPSHHLLIPFLALGAFGVIRGTGNAEGRAVIGGLFVAALACAFYGSAFAPAVASKGWIYAAMGAGWVLGSASGAVSALRRETAGVIFGAGWVTVALLGGAAWIDTGGLAPPLIIVPLLAFATFAIIVGAGGHSDAALSCGIAGVVVATAAYTVAFWDTPGARIGVFLALALGQLLASTFATAARNEARIVTRMLARMAIVVALVLAVTHILSGDLAFHIHATPFALIACYAVFRGSWRHEGLAIAGGIVWALIASGGYALAFLSTVSAHPITSASAWLNVALLIALIGYRLWVGGGAGAGLAHSALAAVSPGRLAESFPTPGRPALSAAASLSSPAALNAGSGAVNQQLEREAWELRRKTLEGVDPMWQEARLYKWVQKHRPTFWTASDEWRDHVLDATCPVCARGFGLDPDMDEEAEEEPAFVCINKECRAALHKQCFLKARGTMSMCPGSDGCSSTLEEGFKPVYRYPTGSGPQRYRTLPEIRGRAKEMGIEDRDNMSRVKLVREIQNRNHHRPCFGINPDSCGEPACEWRTNCISAVNIERFRRGQKIGAPAGRAGKVAPPATAPGPSGISGDFAVSAGDLGGDAGAPAPGPGPNKVVPAVPSLFAQMDTEKFAGAPKDQTFLHTKKDIDVPDAIKKPILRLNDSPTSPSVVEEPLPHSRNETRTPIHNPVLRWPPKQGDWTTRDPE